MDARRVCVLACRFFIANMILIGSVPALASPSFQGIGILGGCESSQALAISADGRVVVGNATHSANMMYWQYGFAWTAATGLIGLPEFTSGTGHTWPQAASADGTVIVGRSGDRACQWQRASGATWNVLEISGCYSGTDAYGVSADGKVIVGQAVPPIQAFRWTETEGVQMLGTLGGAGYSSVAWAVSADGSVVVGRSGSSLGDQAFRWKAGEGMTGFGDIGGEPFGSYARAVSSDGSEIVGGGRQPFLWTASGGIESMGNLPTDPKAISADGLFVVGKQLDYAFLWDETQGFRNLKDVLQDDCQLDLTGWTLTSANGISADGLTIVGVGTNPAGQTEAWVATLPEPATFALLALGGLLLRRRPRRFKP